MDNIAYFENFSETRVRKYTDELTLKNGTLIDGSFPIIDSFTQGKRICIFKFVYVEVTTVSGALFISVYSKWFGGDCDRYAEQ